MGERPVPVKKGDLDWRIQRRGADFAVLTHIDEVHLMEAADEKIPVTVVSGGTCAVPVHIYHMLISGEHEMVDGRELLPVIAFYKGHGDKELVYIGVR